MKIRCISLLCVFLFLTGFPSPSDGKRLYDLAGVLTETTATEIEKKLLDIEQETTAQVSVVTVTSLDGQTVDEYANGLFNSWGIGQRDTNNGALFLIAPNERRVRIEVGYGLEPLLTDSLCGEILDTHVIPNFKSGDTEGGIRAGTEEIIRILRAYPDAARGVPGSAPWFVSSPRNNAKNFSYLAIGLSILLLAITFVSSRRNSYSPLLFFGTIIALFVVVAIAYYWFFSVPSNQRPLKEPFGAIGAMITALVASVRKYFRYGPHYCSKCRTRLKLMVETQDDAHLTEIQKLEEQIGSVDYDVWVCPSCLSRDTERYVAGFSGFVDCPACKHRTFKETSTVAVHATRSSTGLRRFTGNCVSCKHATSRTEIIPRITSSSSSGGSSSGGGSSFGGGRSGGGGASRGW